MAACTITPVRRPPKPGHPPTMKDRSPLLPLPLWRLAFGLCLVLVLVLALVPTPPEPLSTGWDKTNHLLAFGTLAVLGCRAFPRRAVAVLCALLAYGGLIELLQSLTPYRSAEWADWLADGLGLLLGKVLVPVLARLGIR